MLDEEWRRPAKSQDTNCVEVALRDGQVLVRDSKNRDAGTLAFTPAEWDAFVAGAKDGEFDHA